MDKILYDGRILNPALEESFISKGFIIIRDGKIAQVAPGDPPETLKGEWIDLNRKLVLPGMINAHAHLYSSLALGMPPSKKKLSSFTRILEQIWWILDRALDRESVQASFELGLVEHLRAGVTTVIDHHSSPGFIHGSLSLLAKSARRWGMNISGAFEVSDRNGVKVFQESLEENLRFHRAYINVPSIRPLIGLHASFSLSDASLKQISDALTSERNWGIHIHVAEDQTDATNAIERGYTSLLHRLDTFGLLNRNSLVAHGVYFSSEDIKKAEERDIMLVHNPTSNANNRVGLATTDLIQSLKAGLGTDGMQANLLDEARQGSLIRSSHYSGDEWSSDYLELLFRNNPEIATRLFSNPIGRLEPGYQADLAIYDYQPRTQLTSSNWKGHLLYGLSRPCDVITAGEYRLKDYELVDGKIEPIYHRSQVQAGRLWSRMEQLRKEGQ